MLLPFSPKRYEDEPYDVFALRRWTENRLFNLLEKKTIVYPSRHIRDKHGICLPFKWINHGGEKPKRLNLRRIRQAQRLQESLEKQT